MQCDPKNAILPANRAMAYLKVKDWRLAEGDCSLAISLDETYAKAFHRRGTARKNLKDFGKALEDFRHVLWLDPGNKLAQAEIDEIDRLKTPKRAKKVEVASPSEAKEAGIPGQIFPIDKAPHLRSSKPLKRLEIVEVDSHQIEITQVNSMEGQIKIAQATPEKKVESVPPKIEILNIQDHDEEPLQPSGKENFQEQPSKSKGLAQKVEKEINQVKEEFKNLEKSVLKKPKTSVQFGKTWAQIKSSPEAGLDFLCLLNPSDYPKLFKHSMEPAIFAEILATLSSAQGEKKVSRHVLGLSRVPRVTALVMFLDAKQQNQLSQLLQTVHSEGVLSASELREINSCFSAS